MAATPLTSAVIQARMGSTRLPGKVLRELGGRPVVDWVIRAARESGIDDIIVATTHLSEDDPLAAVALQLGVRVVRGSVDDVLSRFVTATSGQPAGAVVRLTADCPMLDPALIRAVVHTWQATGVDYVSTVTPRSLPRGLDVELVSLDTLRSVDKIAAGVDRVHVTSHIYARPDTYDIIGLTVSPPADDLRVTLDTDLDAKLLDGLVDLLGDHAPRWQDTVAALRSNPALRELNTSVVQKKISDG